MICWSCHAEVPRDDAFCPACRRIQPFPAELDHFAVLGLPRRFGLEREALARRHQELTRQLHPDRFARAGPRERRLSLERSTRVNDAYRTLRDDRRRAEYLLRLRGLDPLAESRTDEDPEFLEEQLELRQALAQARSAGDADASRRIAFEGRQRLGRLQAEIAALFHQAEAGGPDRGPDIARRLVRARYYDNLVADAEAPAS